MIYFLSKPDRHINGSVKLDGSKSITNRALLIRALCKQHFEIENCSTSKDSQLMQQLLSQQNGEVFDAGAAGTTFRFLTAYLATREGTQTLTGSERMKQRPIGLLVEALKMLGANIEYLEKQGFPPLRIHSPSNFGKNNELSIPANTSSQYLSALLMIAPTLPNGLKLRLEGNLVSRPYLEMTLQTMQYFGASHLWEGDTIEVPAGEYLSKPFTVEADWSAASYYYALAALSDRCDLTLYGLSGQSWQGDAVLGKMMQAFGVETVFYKNQVCLTKLPGKAPFFEWDFLPCPDIAQTLAVVCAALGTHGLFTGLETLRIKETDRIAALQNELKKVGASFAKLPGRFSKTSAKEHYLVEGQVHFTETPVFQTYDDHRMAMAFAPLAMLGRIGIEHPEVVGKSYPAFWDDLAGLGFEVQKQGGH